MELLESRPIFPFSYMVRADIDSRNANALNCCPYFQPHEKNNHFDINLAISNIASLPI